MRKSTPLIAAIAVALSCAAAHARVTRFVVESTTSLNGGATYGDVGSYQRIRGYVIGELDPAHARNAGIVNLANAPRNGAGLVEYPVVSGGAVVQ